MNCENLPKIYPHEIWYEGFQYSGRNSLPASHTLPNHWIVNPENAFTTKDGMVMQCLTSGELIFNSSLVNLQIRNNSSEGNYLITWFTIGRENMIFDIRGRRSDENNHISLEINAETNRIRIKQTISGIETVLASVDYAIEHELLTVYNFSLLLLGDLVYGLVNDTEIIRATTSISPTIHGTSLYVPNVFEEDPVAFSAFSLRETDTYQNLSFDNHEIFRLFRQLLKENIQCPDELNWSTFIRANKLYEKFKDLGFPNDFWADRGYPIDKPQSEKWFGPRA